MNRSPQPPTPPDDDPGYVVVSDALANETAAMTPSAACPECGEPMPAGAVLCVSCGYDKRAGRRLTPTSDETGRRSKRRKPNVMTGPLVVFGAGGAAVLLFMVLGFVIPALAEPLYWIGILVSFTGFIWCLVVAFGESPSCGIFFFIDCTGIYKLYYIITRWPETKLPFAVALAGSLVTIPFRVAELRTVTQPGTNLQASSSRSDRTPLLTLDYFLNGSNAIVSHMAARKSADRSVETIDLRTNKAYFVSAEQSHPSTFTHQYPLIQLGSATRLGAVQE